MTSPAAGNDLIRRTAGIREKYPHYWRDEQAQAELKALWGDSINPQGVFINATEEVLHDRKGYRAAIQVAGANGLHAFGCSFWAPTQGHCSAPSIWGELFVCQADARAAAIDCLLGQLPTRFFPDEEGQRQAVEQMRAAVARHLRQPSLF